MHLLHSIETFRAASEIKLIRERKHIGPT